MRAFVFTQYGGPENQRFVDLEMPVPQVGEMLIAVHAAGINPKDWKVREGLREREASLDQPVGFGREAAGIVVAIGESVVDFSIGDEVLGSVVVGTSGGIAEYALLRAARSVHKPKAMSFIDASAISVASRTAYNAIDNLGLPNGGTILIIGIGGGVGIAGAQIALAQGLKVIGTASASKREFVNSVGAVHVAYGDGVADRVRSVAENGIDGILDLIGDDALRELGEFVSDGSRIVTATRSKVAIELGGSKVTRVRGVNVLHECVNLAEKGVLQPFVTDVFPFANAADALHLVELGHATGKIVVEVR